MHEGEDEMGVDHALPGVGERPVMGAGGVKVHCPEFIILFDQVAVGEGGGVTIAMESMTERTGRLVEVDRYGSVRISHGKRSFRFVFIVFTESLPILQHLTGKVK